MPAYRNPESIRMFDTEQAIVTDVIDPQVLLARSIRRLQTGRKLDERKPAGRRRNTSDQAADQRFEQ